MKNKSIFESFKNAFEGIWYCLKKERNFKIHLFATVIILLFSVWLEVSRVEFAVLCLSCAAVICFEIVNTTIVLLVDIIVDVYHPKAKIIKDIAAGGVLVCALFSIIIGFAILFDKLLHKIFVIMNW